MGLGILGLLAASVIGGQAPQAVTIRVSIYDLLDARPSIASTAGRSSGGSATFDGVVVKPLDKQLAGLVRESRVRLISSPSVITLDQHEATISISDGSLRRSLTICPNIHPDKIGIVLDARVDQVDDNGNPTTLWREQAHATTSVAILADNYPFSIDHKGRVLILIRAERNVSGR